MASHTWRIYMKRSYASLITLCMGRWIFCLLFPAVLLFAVAGTAYGRVNLLASEGVAGAAANGRSFSPSISYDGVYILFESLATNLPRSETGTFLYDLEDYSLTFLGSFSNATISGDGQTVTFVDVLGGAVRVGQFAIGGATNFSTIGFLPWIVEPPSCNSNASRVTCVAKPSSGWADHVYLRDMVLGTNILVTKPLSGDRLLNACDRPAVDAAGDRVVFRSASTNLMAGVNPAGVKQIFMWTRVTEAITLISQTTGGQPVSSDCGPPAISGDGRWVAFATAAAGVMSGDANSYWDTFLYDTLGDQFYRASTPTGGGWATGPGAGGAAGTYAPRITHDGSGVLFPTEASNLVDGDTNGCVDLYLYESGSVRPISVSSWDEFGNDPTPYGVVNTNAQYVAMVSDAGNIAGFDNNGFSDIYFQNTVAATGKPKGGGGGGPMLYSSGGIPAGGGGTGGAVQMSVHAVLRNLTLQHRLFYHRTVGPPIDITLYYNSGSERAGQFGKKWSLGCHHTVSIIEGHPAFIYGDGREIRYITPTNAVNEFGEGEYELEAPEGIKDRLAAYTCPWDTFYDYLEYDRQYIYKFVSMGYDAELLFVADVHTNSVFYQEEFGYTNRLDYISNGDGVKMADFSNNAEALCTGITFRDQAGAFSRAVSFTYENGCLKTITDMAGNVITMTYDSDGYMLSRSSGSRWMNFTYESQGLGASKLMSSVEDNNGTITYSSGGAVQTPAGRNLSIKSNDRGQATQITRSGGGITTLSYDRYRVSSVKDPNNHTANYTWDADLNMTGFQDARGNSASMTYEALPQNFSMPVTNTYHKPENLTLKNGGLVSMTHTDKGDPESLTTPSGNTFTMNYDTVGLLTSIDEAGSPIYTYTYDTMGNPLTMKDAQNHTATFELDDYWRCIRITDFRGNSKTIAYDDTDRPTTITYESVSGTPSMSFGYDVFDMTSITDERGHVTRVTRDPHANVRTRTPPVGNTSAFTYDADDNKTVVTDPKGRVTQMIYDGDSQMTRLIDALGNSAHRTYDAAGNVTQIQDQRGNATTFTYDEENNVTTIQNPLGQTTTYSYDAENRMVGKVNARGQSVSNTVDTSGRITLHEAHGLTDVTQTYDAHGNRLTRTDVTGTETYTYDSLNRVEKVTYPDSKSVDYDYDSIGNITKITYPGIFEVNYTYDDFCRMPVPNFYISKVISQIGIPPEKKNRVTAISWTGAQTLSCTFDGAANLLTETRNGTMVTTYTYDNNARRTRIYHDSGSAALVDVVMTYDGADNIITRTVTGPSEPTLVYDEIRATYNALNSITEWNGSVVTNDPDGNLCQYGSTFTAQYDVENRLTRYEAAGVTNIFTYNGAGFIATASINGQMRKFYYSPYGRLLFEANGAGTITRYYVYRENMLVAVSSSGASDHQHLYTDINGNVLVVTDESGTVLEENSYTPYALNTTTGTLTDQPFRFSGALGAYDFGSDLVLMKRRIYNMRFGRFMQPDPLGYSAGTHLFLYGNANPLSNVDPEGTLSFKSVSDFIWGQKGAIKKARGFGTSFQKSAAEDERMYKASKQGRTPDARLESLIEVQCVRNKRNVNNAFNTTRQGANALKSFGLNAADSVYSPPGPAGKVVSEVVSALDGYTDLDIDPIETGGSVYGGTPDSGGMSKKATYHHYDINDWDDFQLKD